MYIIDWSRLINKQTILHFDLSAGDLPVPSCHCKLIINFVLSIVSRQRCKILQQKLWQRHIQVFWVSPKWRALFKLDSTSNEPYLLNYNELHDRSFSCWKKCLLYCNGGKHTSRLEHFTLYIRLVHNNLVLVYAMFLVIPSDRVYLQSWSLAFLQLIFKKQGETWKKNRSTPNLLSNLINTKRQFLFEEIVSSHTASVIQLADDRFLGVLVV